MQNRVFLFMRNGVLCDFISCREATPVPEQYSTRRGRGFEWGEQRTGGNRRKRWGEEKGGSGVEATEGEGEGTRKDR